MNELAHEVLVTQLGGRLRTLIATCEDFECLPCEVAARDLIHSRERGCREELHVVLLDELEDPILRDVAVL